MAESCVTVRLNKTVVDQATPGLDAAGKPRQRVYSDTVLRGFCLVVGQRTKTFYARRKVGGRLLSAKIDQYPRITVDTARLRAEELLAAMGKGENPTQERKQRAARGMTLGEAWTLYQDHLRAQKRSDNTLRRYQQCLDLYLSDWMDRPLVEITTADVQQRHQRLARDIAAGKYAQRKNKVTTTGGKVEVERRAGDRLKPFNRTGEASANHTFRVLRAIWVRARKQHRDLPPHPCDNNDWFKVKPRRNPIPDHLLPLWHAGVRALDNPVKRDVLTLMLFTGLRKESAAVLRWADVDLDARTLHVPKPKGGADRAFTIPLSDYLVALLRERQADNEVRAKHQLLPAKSPFVFPAFAASGHIEEPRLHVKGVEYLRDGEPHPYSLHDLRATFVTQTEALDVSAYALKALVNHAQEKSDVTGSYILINVERLRAPMQQITDKLLALTRPPSPAPDNVRQLKRRA